MATFTILSGAVLGSAFVSMWRTTAFSEQVELPYLLAGTYGGNIDWGDGSLAVPNTYGNRFHTYATPGDYTIVIDGVIEGFSFRGMSNANKDRIRNISQWGNIKLTTLALGTTEGYFEECQNLTITATDILDTSEHTEFSGMFVRCSVLTDVPNIHLWDWSNITNIRNMFDEALLYNDPNIALADTSSVTDMTAVFALATAFDQDLSNWVFSNVTTMSAFMTGKTNGDYSAANYDALLNRLITHPIQSGVTLDMGTIEYTTAGAGFAHSTLTGTYGWTINDGGGI